MEHTYLAPFDGTKVEKHSLQIVKGAGISFVGNTVGKVLSFFTQIVIARGLGASGYGLYALAESILTVLRLVASLGLGHGGVLKFVSVYAGEEDLRRLKGVINAALSLSLCSSMVLVSLLFLFSTRLAVDIFHEPDLSVLLRILSLALPFDIGLLMVAAVAQALRRMEYDALLRSFLVPVANLAGISVAVLLGLGLYGMAWCIVASMVLSVFGGLFVLKQAVYGKLDRVVPVYSNKALLSVSLPVVLVSLSSVVLSQLGKLVLGAFKSSADVGVYNAAFRIAWSLQLILLSFGIVPPIVADLYKRRKIEELRDVFSNTTRWVFSVVFPLFLIMVLFPGELMGIFGSGFTKGWPILVVFSLLFLMASLAGLVGPMLRMTGSQRIEAVIDAASALLSILFSLILVQQYGALGVAVGIVLAVSIRKVAKIVAVYIVLGIHPYDRRLLRPVIIGLLGLAAVWILRSLNLTIPEGGKAFLEASILIGVYTGLGLLFFPDEDKAMLKLIFARVARRTRKG
jgi:O-antigen/teichoic acid export membrane protein